MSTLLRILGGIILTILGIFIFRSAIGLLFQGPIGFIIGIALIAGVLSSLLKHRDNQATRGHKDLCLLPIKPQTIPKVHLGERQISEYEEGVYLWIGRWTSYNCGFYLGRTSGHPQTSLTPGLGKLDCRISHIDDPSTVYRIENTPATHAKYAPVIS